MGQGGGGLRVTREGKVQEAGCAVRPGIYPSVICLSRDFEPFVRPWSTGPIHRQRRRQDAPSPHLRHHLTIAPAQDPAGTLDQMRRVRELLIYCIIRSLRLIAVLEQSHPKPWKAPYKREPPCLPNN